MTGWLLHVGITVWPPSWWVEFTPGDTESDGATSGSSLTISDRTIEVEDCDGTYVNRRPLGYR